MTWTEAKEREVQRRVNLIQNCLHARCHYLDANGNRHCLQCDGMIREIPGVPMLRRETRTLTNGWVQPMWEWSRQQTIRAHEMYGLPAPEIPDPEIRHQERYLIDWQDVQA